MNSVETEVYAAVRYSALGDSIVQLYPSNHLAADMLNYTASVDSSCQLSLKVDVQAGMDAVNITTACSGVLAVLSSRFQISRGSTCESVTLFVIPYVVPTPPTGTIASPTAAPTSSCILAPYFTILVNETGTQAQYLYDPNSVDDEALSFTNDPSQSLIFSLTQSGQLEFTVTDIWNNPVLLVSEQDVQNAGNEAVFFTTAARFSSLGYEPVIASLNDDCTLSLNLPYNAANIIQVSSFNIFQY